MPSAPLISVIVPLHNREQVLERCLDSLLHQDYAPLEVLLVDNASTDGTLAKAQSWLAQHHAEMAERTACFRLLQEPRLGADYARRTGLEAARGQWVAFFDDDDEFSPNFLPQMLHSLSQKPTARWGLARTCMLMPDGTSRIRHGTSRPTLAHHLLASLVSTQSFVAQRQWLLDIGAWQPHLPLWNDYYLGALLLLHDPHPAWCEGVFHRIYQHSDSLTGVALWPKWESALAALLALDSLLQQAAQEGYIPPRQQQATRRALYFRLCLTAGRLRREGHGQAARMLHARWLQENTFASRQAPLSAIFWRGIGALLETYIAWGGRGGWRLALWCC